MRRITNGTNATRTNTATRSLRASLAVAASIGMLLAGTAIPSVSYADDVDDAQAAYDAAIAEYEGYQQQADEVQTRLDELNETLPKARENAADAMRSMYLRNKTNESLDLISSIMSSDSLDEAITMLQYDFHLTSASQSKIDDLQKLLDEQTAAKSELDAKLEEAQEAVDKAQDALTSAKEAKEAAKRAAATSRSSGTTSSGGAAAAGMEEVDWSVDEETFVSKWAPRIDAYLAGYALEGNGENFARAAYQYGVDPRWSPAISCVESTKGNFCFKNCNAWGWGGVAWSNWSEAIYDHVAGLAAGYGSFPTQKNSAKYCPPHSFRWYTRCLEEMAKI